MPMRSFVDHTVVKKLFMSVSGLIMFLFVIIHVIGNSTIFFDSLNAYAETLHSLPALVWMTRLIMGTMFSVHIFFGIQMTLVNFESKPDEYAVKKSLSTTFAGKNMIWTGLITGMFIMYHLLHFTIQVINPGISASIVSDTLGRPDVTGMVVSSFKTGAISLTYVLAMSALVLHLAHGIQSSFQTLGLASERTLPVIIKTGAVLAFILFLGYVSVPILVFAGIMNG